MNYAIAAVIWCVTLVGAFWYGNQVGGDREVAKQVKIDQVVAATREAAQQGAADAIAKNKPYNNYIKGRVETIVRENTVYRDCAHTPDGLRLINEALTGRPVAPGGSVVPRVNAVN